MWYEFLCCYAVAKGRAMPRRVRIGGTLGQKVHLPVERSAKGEFHEASTTEIDVNFRSPESVDGSTRTRAATSCPWAPPRAYGPTSFWCRRRCRPWRPLMRSAPGVVLGSPSGRLRCRAKSVHPRSRAETGACIYGAEKNHRGATWDRVRTSPSNSLGTSHFPPTARDAPQRPCEAPLESTAWVAAPEQIRAQALLPAVCGLAGGPDVCGTPSAIWLLAGCAPG